MSKLSAAIWVVASGDARADPLRLRADALVQSRAPAPVGLLILRGENRFGDCPLPGQPFRTCGPVVDAETVTWLGMSAGPDATGDVLTISARVRDAASGSELRAGRMIVSTGAVRPIHLDGARGLVRLFKTTTAEAFGGVPVVPRMAHRTFDWAAGGRAAQSVRDQLTIGASYVQRRSDGRPFDEEAGADFALTPAPWLTAAGRWAYDLASCGTTDALASVSAQNRDLRGEAFLTYRSPGRLLPSTSLFSVLGDYPATSVGSSARWRMFPRLSVVGSGSGQVQDDTVGGQGALRATLSLDEDGAGSLGFEGRRVTFGDARWSGGRVLATVPFARIWRVSSEVELVLPDRPRGRGAVWPWALGAIGLRPAAGWDVAGAVEVFRGPDQNAALHAIGRVSYAFERGAR